MSEENGHSNSGVDGSSLRVFISSVSSNREVKHKQQKVFMILESKKIPHEKVDIATSEDDKNRMREVLGDPKAMPPQFFKGDDYLGDFEAFDDAVEDGDLNTFLRL